MDNPFQYGCLTLLKDVANKFISLVTDLTTGLVGNFEQFNFQSRQDALSAFSKEAHI